MSGSTSECDSLLEADNQNKWARCDGQANQPATKSIAVTPLQITHRKNHQRSDDYFEKKERGKHYGGRYLRAALRLCHGYY